MSFLSKLFFGSEQDKGVAKDSITVRDHDGSVDIADYYANAPGGLSNYDFFLASLPDGEKAAIEQYRRLAMNAEVDMALQEIVNESFNITQGQKAISLEFQESSKLSAALQAKILDAYEYVYHDLFDFDARGAWLFRKWYVDGRLFIHKVLSKDKKHIMKLRVIEPLQIRRIRNTHADEYGLVDISKEEVKYVFIRDNKQLDELWGFKANAAMPTSLVIFPEQSIAYIDSGLIHPSNGYIIGHLSKAIIPYNNMKMMEDSMVIYRVVRSPARRVFYVDVAQMPKAKGEQYLRDLMMKFKNKMVYDNESGAVVDKRQVISMLEDIWLPRGANGRSTEVSMLDEGTNVGETADVEYCRNTFYSSLNVPRSRFDENANNPFSASRLTEINRDEYRFLKFIQSLRNRFSGLIEDVLRTELELRGIITTKEWKDIQRDIAWVYAEDNQFVQLKQSEILNNRISTLAQIDSLTDQYVSKEWALRHIMQFNDEQINELREQISNEKEENPNDYTDE